MGLGFKIFNWCIGPLRASLASARSSLSGLGYWVQGCFPSYLARSLRFRVEGSRLQVILAECLPFWGFGCAATGVGGSAGSGYGASLTVVACPCAATHPHVRLQVVWELGVLGFRVARSDPSY